MAIKVFSVLSCFLLCVCLVLSVTALVALRTAVAENEALQNRADLLLHALGESVDDLSVAVSAAQKEELTPTEEVNNDLTKEIFTLKESDGKIGVYTSDGALIKLLDVRVDTLPEADRDALAVGIPAEGWRELLNRIEDYSGS